MTLATRRLTICLSLALAAHAGLLAAVANVDLAPRIPRDRTLTVTFSTQPTRQSATGRAIARQPQSGDDRRSQARREKQAEAADRAAFGHVPAGKSAPKYLRRPAAAPMHRLATGGTTRSQPAPKTSKTAPTPLSRSARRDPRAAYLTIWRQRVERYGNSHYPGDLIVQAPHPRLTLGVTLLADGSLHDVRVLQSSGSPALDRAARNIVRNAGPYPRFPAALRARQHSMTFAYDWIFDSAS